MPLAELVLSIAGIALVYFLLRPVQRRLERYLVRKFAHGRRGHLPTIDITDFRSSHRTHEKEEDE